MNPGIAINVGSWVDAVTFSADGEYLSSGDEGNVRVWRVKDGRQMTIMKAKNVLCLAMSNDSRWIAAGTAYDGVFVWNAKRFEKVSSHGVAGVDFSPDSSRLVSASDDGKATIWDIATRKRIQTLRHTDSVTGAKYSPQGDRIATATKNSVRVWDSNDGRLLKHIKVTVTPWRNTGLLWFNHHLLVVSKSKIKQFEASTGSAVSEWPVPDSSLFSCVALPKHGGFIAYSTQRTVTFWDTATHTQLGLIRHPQKICSIALSPDDRFLAIGGGDGKISVGSLSRIAVSILSRCTGAYQQLSCSDRFSLVYTPHSRNQTFGSTTPPSTLGSTINSRSRKLY